VCAPVAQAKYADVSTLDARIRAVHARYAAAVGASAAAPAATPDGAGAGAAMGEIVAASDVGIYDLKRVRATSDERTDKAVAGSKMAPLLRARVRAGGLVHPRQ